MHVSELYRILVATCRFLSSLDTQIGTIEYSVSYSGRLSLRWYCLQNADRTYRKTSVILGVVRLFVTLVSWYQSIMLSLGH